MRDAKDASLPILTDLNNTWRLGMFKLDKNTLNSPVSPPEPVYARHAIDYTTCVQTLVIGVKGSYERYARYIVMDDGKITERGLWHKLY